MRIRIVGSSCAAVLLACAVGAAGQITAQPPSESPVGGATPESAPRSSAPSPRITTDQPVTIVGCIARARGTRPGESAKGYVIENAAASRENPHPSATGTTGADRPDAAKPPSVDTPGGSTTAGIAGATAETGKTYALAGPKADDLSSYVGQRVQVVGRVQGGAIGGRTPGLSDDTAPSGDEKPLPRVTIVSVRPIAGACS